MFMVLFLPPPSCVPPLPSLSHPTTPAGTHSSLQTPGTTAEILLLCRDLHSPASKTHSRAAAFIFLLISRKVTQRNVFANRTSGSWYLPPSTKSWQRCDCCREGRSEPSQTLMPCDLQLSVAETCSLVFAAQSFRGWKPVERLLLISVGFLTRPSLNFWKTSSELKLHTPFFTPCSG